MLAVICVHCGGPRGQREEHCRVTGSGLHSIKEEWPSACSSEVLLWSGFGPVVHMFDPYSPGVLAVGGGAEGTALLLTGDVIPGRWAFSWVQGARAPSRCHQRDPTLVVRVWAGEMRVFRISV